jgi:serine/threonine protein kinase
MICPSCQTPNDDGDEVCFHCRSVLGAVTAGTVIAGRYEVLGRLGRGGMGTVYKARDRELDEPVALKVLRSDLAHSPDMARRFLSEIKLARRIGHRNVCRIFEYGQDGAVRFIAMELVEGTDLKQLLRARGPLPWEEAFDVSLQIGHGLAAIHELGIVHRDLKTMNIMLDARGIVRVMDFGIAKRFEADTGTGATATGHIVGTPEYMSPEQARAERVDARSDIYALGIVIYEVFTGSVPFKGDTPVATLLMHVHTPPPLATGDAVRLPDALRPVLARALNKTRDERYASVTEMIPALQAAAAAAGLDVAATRGSSLARASPPATTSTPTLPIASPGRPEAQGRGRQPDVTPRAAASDPTVSEATPVPDSGARRGRLRRVVGSRGLVLMAALVATALVALLRREAVPPPAPMGGEGGVATPTPEGMRSAGPPSPSGDVAPRASATPDADDTRAAPALEAPRGLAARRSADRTGSEARWNAVAGAAGYHVLVGTDASLKRIVVDRSVKAPATLISGLPSGRYYWRVAAVAAGGGDGAPSRTAVLELESGGRSVSAPQPAAALSTPPPTVATATVAPHMPPSPMAPMPSPTPAAPAQTSTSEAAPPPSQATIPPTPRPTLDNGVLHLVVVPFAEATVDDRPIGRVTTSDIPLAPGAHVIVLNHPEYQPLRRRFTIVSTVTFPLVIDLSEEGLRRKK